MLNTSLMETKPPHSKLSVFSWCMYDFANSSFTTLVVTFIYAAYFTKEIAADELTGTSLWSRSLSVTAVAAALLAPPLGALADRGGYRKLLLFVSTVVAVLASVLLYTAEPGEVVKALLCFTLANIAFEMGTVFYNAFLPDITAPDRIGRTSGFGWSLGYLGGLAAMGLATVALVQPTFLDGFAFAAEPWFGFSRENGENFRATTLLVAGWFAVFSLPIFLWVKEDKSAITREPGLLAASFRQLLGTFREVKRYRQIVRFLVARLFYNDGLVTIFAFGGVYAVGTFGFSLEELATFGIVLNVAAGIGAFALGFLDDYLGSKRTIQISLWGLILAATAAVLTHERWVFWMAATLVGICAGPNQAASRSLLGRFVPPSKENEFYGLFAFSGKATAFLGPLLLGELTRIFSTQRVGMAVVLIFFAVGLSLLVSVDEKAGILMAGRDPVDG